MRWVDSSVELMDNIDAAATIAKVESACRTCYQSFDKISEGSGERLIKSCIKRGHESPLEHQNITFRIICDRACANQIVRHRIASYSQESSRYCNYNQGKYGSELTFVYPYWYHEVGTMEDDNQDYRYRIAWSYLQDACFAAEQAYMGMINSQIAPDIARASLPSCTKTDIVCTMNLRELRHFIKLRTSAGAHGDVKHIAELLLMKLRDAGLSVFFEDIDSDLQ